MRVRLHAESGKTIDIDEDDVGEFKNTVMAPFGRGTPIEADAAAVIAQWLRNQASTTRNMDASLRLRTIANFLSSNVSVMKVERLS